MKKKWIRPLFWIYFLILMDVIVFKFFGNVNDVMNNIMINKHSVEIDSSSLVNLIPFRTLLQDITYSPAHLLLNVIIFIPFGILFPLSYPRHSNFLTFTLIALLSICGIEFIQRITYLGIFDIDDILLNLLGCFIGYIVVQFLVRPFLKSI